VKVAPGQEYGQAQVQEQAQQQMPLPAAPDPMMQQAGNDAAFQQALAAAQADVGAPIGLGGPVMPGEMNEAMRFASTNQPTSIEQQLRELFMADPGNEDIRQLLEMLDTGGL
jgi:hypothetical protein